MTNMDKEQADRIERKLDAIAGEVTLVHGIVRNVQREAVATRGRLEVLIDAYGTFRSEYLTDHPHSD